MITLRNGSAAILHNNGNVLLMKRSLNKKIAPGVWGLPGGHMEPHEINHPMETCYREIEEETGIHKDDITPLELLYVITRRSCDEIRQSYIYMGETTKTETTKTEEGTLHWIPECELLNHEYTQTFSAMLKHYTARNPQDRAVYVGVASNNNGNLQMTWTCCEDFDQL